LCLFITRFECVIQPQEAEGWMSVGQGIDNIGIKPDRHLYPNDDWIKAAVSEVGK
jgi:hypothetical protein